MIRIVLPFIAVLALFLYSCKDMKSNSPMEEAMKDSIFKAYPGINYTQIRVLEHSDVTVFIGDKDYFNTTDERREELVKHLAEMTVYYFEENNYLDDGKVIFVPNETTVPTDDDPKKEYDMHLKDYLKK